MEFTEEELFAIRDALRHFDKFVNSYFDGHKQIMLIAKLAQTSHNEQVKIVVQDYELNKK